MPTMIERVCAYRRCRAKFMARSADVKRGWGRFCSKSCKASEQESRTHQNANHFAARQRGDGDMDVDEVIGYQYDAVKGWLG